MPAILDALRGRIIQREATALDTVVAGARAAARGEAYDVGAIESALAEIGKSVADFEKMVEAARARITWLSDFDKLTSSLGKIRKLEAAAAAENEKFENVRSAYLERITAIDRELALYLAARDRGEEGRYQLLDPRHVPGTLGEKYREAKEKAQEADAAVERIAREIHEHAEREKSEEEWIEQLVGEERRTIGPDILARLRGAQPEEPLRLQEHRAALARAQRRKAEAEAALVEAQKAAAVARKAVDALVPEVLKA